MIDTTLVSRLGLSALLLTLILSGCATLKTETDLAKYSAGWPDIIRAEAIVELDSDRRLKGRAIILAKVPDRFRIEVRGPFGRLIGLLLSDGDNLTVFADGELKTYRWSDPALPYPFSAEEFVSFLLGKNDLAPGAPTEGYAITRNKVGKIAKIVKFEEGNPILSVDMSDYKANAGYAVPHSISLKDDRRGLELKIRYTSVEINPDIKEDVFKISPLSPQQ